jgi:hypothetical protein
MPSIRQPEEPWTEKRTLGGMMHRCHDGRAKKSQSAQESQQHGVILRAGINDVVLRRPEKEAPLKHNIADTMVYPSSDSANVFEGDYVDI